MSEDRLVRSGEEQGRERVRRQAAVRAVGEVEEAEEVEE